MADRYWVGGTGTWNTTSTTNWSATSGGASGASVPTVADSVFFDQASTYTVTMTGALACLNFNVTGGTVTFQNGTTPTLDVRGGWSTVAATVWNTTGAITFSATTSRTITTNAITIRSPITFNGVGGTWTLQDNVTLLSTLTTTLSAGTLALNNFTLSTGIFTSTTTTTRVITFGTTGQITITGNAATVLNMATLTGFTYTGTATIYSSYNGATGTRTFLVGSVAGVSPTNTFSVSFGTSGTGLVIAPATDTVSLQGTYFNADFTNLTNTVSNDTRSFYGNLTVPASGGTFTAGANVTNIVAGIAVNINVQRTLDFPFSVNSVGGTLNFLNNFTIGSTRTFTLTAGTLALSTFTLTTGLFNSSNSNARTINFGTGKIVLNSATTNTIWTTGTTTNLTISGTPLVECIGGGTAVTKTINTGALSEANSISFSLLDTGGTPTYTFTASNVVRNLIVNGAQTVSNIAITIFGAFTHLTTNGTTTFTAGANAWTFAATSGSYTINNIAGFTYDFPWTFGSAASTATWTIAANLTLGATRQLSLTNGTFDFNNKTFSGAGVTIVTGTPTIANTGGPGSLSLTVPITHTSGSLTLPFNLTTTSASGYTLTAGTLTLNNFTLTAPAFSSSSASARTLAFGTTGQLALTGNGVTIFNLGTVTNLTITGTFYVNCTYTGSVGTRTILWGSVAGSTEALAQNVSFSGTTGIVLSPSATDTIALSGGFNNIDFTGFTGTLSNTGRTIFGNLTVPASGGTFTAGTIATTFGGTGTETITTNGRTLDFPITFSGVGGTFRLLDNLTVGSTRLVTLSNGTLDLNNFTLSAGQFNSSGSTARTLAFGTGQLALTGNNLTLFDITTATNFSTTGTVYVKLITGSVGTRTFVTGFTEAQASAGYNVSTSGTSGIVITPSGNALDIIALTGNYNNVDLTGFTNTLSNTARTIYGNLIVPASGGTLTAGANATTFAGTGTETITTNGRLLDFPITFNGVGGTFQLQDNLSIGTRTATLTAGNLALNNRTLSAATFSATGTVARSVAFGTTGLISLAGNNGTIVNLTNMTNFTYTGTPRIYSAYAAGVGTRTFNFGDTTATGVTTTNIFDFSILDELASDGGAGIGVGPGDDGGGGGGGIGGGIPTTVDVNGGYTGGVPFNINGLSTAVVGAGYTFGSGAGAAGGLASTPLNAINGGNATGFGAGGGGAGYFGGNGGNGFLGGGGGGAAGRSGTQTGGNGGGGAIVIQMTVNGSPQYVVLTSGTTYNTPAGTTNVKIWAIGAGGGGAGAINNDSTTGGGGGAGGIDIITSTNTGTITYSIGAAGAGGVGATDGSAGGTTTATFDGQTATAYGGLGGGYNNGVGGAGGSTTPRGLIDFTGIGLKLQGLDIVSLIGSYNNFDLTRFNGTFGNSTRFIYGNLTVPSTGGSFTAGTAITSFVGSGSKTLSTSGRSLDFPVTIDGVGSSFQLLSNFAIGSTRAFTHNNGTINLNGYTLTVGSTYTTGAGTKNLTFNGGTLVCPGTSVTAFNNAVTAGFTTTAGTGTATISMTGATAKTFVGGSITYNCDIDQGGLGTLTITGINTFNRIKSSYADATANTTILLPANETTVISGITGGSASNKLLGFGSVANTRANVVIYDADFQTASFLQTNSVAFIVSEINRSTQSSVFFDGNSDWLQTPGNSAFSIATSTTPFTVECWIYPTAAGGVIFTDQFTGAGDPIGITISMTDGVAMPNTTGQTIGFGAYSGSAWSTAAMANTTVPLNAWTHVACVFTGSTTKIFLNGVDRTSAGALSTWPVTGNNGQNWYIGRRWDAGSTPWFSGYISNLRFVNGTAVYTSNFTPPTSALTAIANTRLLTCQGTTFVDNGPNNFTITASGDTTVSHASPFDNSTNGGTPWKWYFANSVNNGDTLGAVFQRYNIGAPILYYIKSGTTFRVPYNWDSSNNAVHIWGGGGGSSGSYVVSAAGNRLGSAGGGGGGYTQVLNFSTTPGSTVTYSIGAGGTAGAAGLSTGGNGGVTTFASVYTANGGGGSTITSTTTTGGVGGIGATANGGIGGLGGGAAAEANNSSGGGGGGSGGPNGVGANGGTGTIAATPGGTAGGGGGGSGGGTNGTNAVTATPGVGGNNFAGTRSGGNGGLGTVNGGTLGGIERGRVTYDIANSAGGAGGGGGGGAYGPSVNDPLSIGGGAGGSGATDGDFQNAGTVGQSGGIIIIYYPVATSMFAIV